jgi:ABC-type sugar transport system substrate-binding protein
MKWRIAIIAALVLSVAVNMVLGLSRNHNAQSIIPPVSDEDYVYLAVFKAGPLIDSDQAGLDIFAREYDVNAYIVAPQEFDAVEQARLITETIGRKPAGIMVCGSDNSLTPYINKAVEAGIPTIAVDADLPDSKRLAFVGTDWYDLGARQAKALAELLGGAGTVAMLGMVGAPNTDSAARGFMEAMQNYPDIYVLDVFDDMGSREEAVRITKQIVDAYSIKGIAGFDSNSGPGIAQGLKELGLQGEVKVTCVDSTPEHRALLKEGLVQKLFGQKRQLFTYYGCKVLYDLNHSGLSITKEDAKNAVTNIPHAIYTGVIELDQSNLDQYFMQ